MINECVFCKIAAGKLPSRKVFEDSNFMGIMDIAPLNEGQVLLIPKEHYRWTWDVPNFGDYWEAAKKVAKAQMKGLDANMVEFLTHGMDVHHAHIWIVPIYGDEAFIKSENRLKVDDAKMDELADKIVKALDTSK